jgi:hypothetical protein
MAIVNYHPSPITTRFFFHCEHTSERNLATFTHHHSLFGNCERSLRRMDNVDCSQIENYVIPFCKMNVMKEALSKKLANFI